VSEGKDTRRIKNCSKAHFLKDCIFPLLVDLCWRHGARPVSTVSWGWRCADNHKMYFPFALLIFASDTGHAEAAEKVDNNSKEKKVDK
jgi:hypothetical protein